MASEEQVYSIVYAGSLVPGKPVQEVKNNLARLFKRDAAELDALFTGRVVTVKKGVDLPLARKYVAAMAQAGAVAEIVPAPVCHGRNDKSPVPRPAESGVPAKQDIPAKPGSDPSSNPDVILKAFSGRIKPVRVTLAYRFWLLMVAVAMVILGLVYVGVTAVGVYGLYKYISADLAYLEAVRSHGSLGSSVVALTLYLTPLVAGGFLVVIMLRPFFLFGQAPRSIILGKDQQPLVFDFVGTICERVGAPKPAIIELDNQVNASASFHGALFRGGLKLTVGAPLVAGLNTRQFAGVLAHELGHFSQGAGMRLTALIRWVNAWFAGAVYYRGGLDNRLEALYHSSDSMWVPVFWVALFVVRIFVRFVRGLLRLFMTMGHFISGAMLRHMELDADRYEARMSGSRIFAATTSRMLELELAMGALHKDLYTTWEHHHYLVDNLAEAVVDKACDLPRDAREEIRDHIEGGETGLFDTHPCERERIANAEREDSPGIFAVELPAAVLFKDFDALARRTTLRYYKDYLGLSPTSEQLVSVDKIKGNVGSNQNAMDVLDGYFGGSFNPFVALDLPDLHQLGFGGKEGMTDTWRQAVDAQSRQSGPAKLAWSRWNKADSQYYNALAACTAMDVGVAIDPRSFGLRAAEPELAQGKLNDAGATLADSMEKLGSYYEIVVRKLCATLGFLFRDDIAIEVKDRQSLRTQVESIMSCLPVLQNALQHVQVLRDQLVILQVLFQASDQLPEQHQRGVTRGLNRAVEDSAGKMRAIYSLFGEIPYPFEHARGHITLRQYAFAKDPDTMSPGETVNEIETVVDKVTGLHTRILAQLVMIAHDMESQLELSTT